MSRATDPAQLTIDTIRVLAMDAVQKANAGHPGTAMALAPVAYVLYAEEMRHDPAAPEWPGRDRFVLSAGHACILQYAALHLCGYDLTLDDLKQFRQWGSRTPGHPELHDTPGIETTTGPLGQGVGNAIGMALAQRFLADRWNRPRHTIVDSWVYGICSDGDLMEGVSQEAASIAGQHGLGRLVFVYDDNHITIDGTTALSFDREDTGARFEANGWQVQYVADPNDLDALRSAFADARSDATRPSLIVVRSHIAYPAPNAIDTAKAHGSPLGEDEVRATKGVLGWDPDEHFVVPDEVREHMAGVAERGMAARDQWEARLATWRDAWPEVAAERERDLEGRPRDGWLDALPSFEAGDEVATRDAGKTVMQALRPFTPTQIGGAADLVESTKTEFIGTGTFSATHVGRNVPFGIREHGMGSIVNGIALEPAMLKPYGSTFLVFSDYMRPSVRLSALSRLPLMWIWTHDSIGLGEDGPTHQPVEHVMSLRAIPNLWVIRPGDANETVAGWRVALEREGGPRRARVEPPEAAGARWGGSRVDRGGAAPRGVCPLAAGSVVDAGRDRPGDRLGGLGSRSRPHGRSTRTPASSRCRAGSSSTRRTRRTARRCCRPRSAPACRSRRGSPSAGSDGSGRTGCGSASTASAPPRRGRGCTRSSG